ESRLSVFHPFELFLCGNSWLSLNLSPARPPGLEKNQSRTKSLLRPFGRAFRLYCRTPSPFRSDRTKNLSKKSCLSLHHKVWHISCSTHRLSWKVFFETLPASLLGQRESNETRS